MSRSLGVLLALCLALACSRKAEVRDDPDAGMSTPPPIPQEGGGIPLVDAGLDDPARTTCQDREEDQDCRGANDFPCDFFYWVPVLAERCQKETGCVTNGWVGIALGDDGCATELRLDAPNPEFVSCIAEALATHRCPCGATEASYFLGIDNRGCEPMPKECRSGEFPCEGGEVCVDGFCVPEPGTGGQPG